MGALFVARNKHIGSFRETDFARVLLPFNLSNVQQLLEYGLSTSAPYTHQQICDWAQRFASAIREDPDEPTRNLLLDITADIGVQWDLFLYNSYSFTELQTLDFSQGLLATASGSQNGCENLNWRRPNNALQPTPPVPDAQQVRMALQAVAAAELWRCTVGGRLASRKSRTIAVPKTVRIVDEGDPMDNTKIDSTKFLGICILLSAIVLSAAICWHAKSTSLIGRYQFQPSNPPGVIWTLDTTTGEVTTKPG